MRIKYSEDADILLISLREGKLADSIDLKEGVILHGNLGTYIIL
jgi:uncharacterized protein YuzE